MATNLLAPNGLSFDSNRRASAPTYQGNRYFIKAGYATAIGKGDLVKTGTGTYQGYIIPSALTDTIALGVFAAVLPYYDLTIQGTGHGLNGAWPTNANPQSDVGVLIYDDPDAEFIAQVSGGPWLQSWRGQNINFLTGTNGAPNSAGTSTLALDATTIGTSNTLPFRIVDYAYGPGDTPGFNAPPVNVNPWIRVKLNNSENNAPTGV
jgi:hypothetical protein